MRWQHSFSSNLGGRGKLAFETSRKPEEGHDNVQEIILRGCRVVSLCTFLARFLGVRMITDALLPPRGYAMSSLRSAHSCVWRDNTHKAPRVTIVCYFGAFLNEPSFNFFLFRFGSEESRFFAMIFFFFATRVSRIY